MTSQLDRRLDCHPASPEETLAAHRNVFDVWPCAPDIEDHLRIRKDLPKSLRADYFVGTVEGVVATSLQSFTTNFQIHGRPVKAMQIGSVHTHADFRKQGYAELLIDFAEKYQAAHGFELSVLYCDIALAYYEKMGYVKAASKMGWFKTAEWSADRLAEAPELVEIDPRDQLTALMKLHEGATATRPISVVRDSAYWDYTLRKFPNDLFWALPGTSGMFDGFVRIGKRDDRAEIVDWIVAEDRDDLLAPLFTGMVKRAEASGFSEVGGWLPDREPVRRLIELSDRQKQITMFKPLVEDLVIDNELLIAANDFVLIDHV